LCTIGPFEAEISRDDADGVACTHDKVAPRRSEVIEADPDDIDGEGRGDNNGVNAAACNADPDGIDGEGRGDNNGVNARACDADPDGIDGEGRGDNDGVNAGTCDDDLDAIDGEGLGDNNGGNAAACMDMQVSCGSKGLIPRNGLSPGNGDSARGIGAPTHCTETCDLGVTTGRGDNGGIGGPRSGCRQAS